MTCTVEQQSDEFFCSLCGMRWAVTEEKPHCKVKGIDRAIFDIEMTGKITGRERDRYQQLRRERNALIKR
jgi:hypothetical protein